MTNTIQSILERIYDLEAKKVVEKIDRPAFEKFLNSAVNGDELADFIAFAGTIDSKRGDGILAYILTNVRLIKLEIDNKEFQASEFYLKDITNIERALVTDKDGPSHIIKVHASNGGLGLMYPSAEEWITTFFQKIEMKMREIKK